MPNTISKEEESHIVGYTKPKGLNGIIFPIYDEYGYVKYAMKRLADPYVRAVTPVWSSPTGSPVIIEIKKVIVSFD
jgi:hypothetical protein